MQTWLATLQERVQNLEKFTTIYKDYYDQPEQMPTIRKDNRVTVPPYIRPDKEIVTTYRLGKNLDPIRTQLQEYHDRAEQNFGYIRTLDKDYQDVKDRKNVVTLRQNYLLFSMKIRSLKERLDKF
ncbi:hypothetical protein ACF0H5_001804 [Mactra antiquata]